MVRGVAAATHCDIAASYSSVADVYEHDERDPEIAERDRNVLWTQAVPEMWLS